MPTNDEDESDAVYVFRGQPLPAHLRASLDAYAISGRPTGGFLRACISNDLQMAILRADDVNLPIIPAVIGYLNNRCPVACWGKPEAWDEWIRLKFEERQKAEKEDA
jgi:hypothetical protein